MKTTTVFSTLAAAILLCGCNMVLSEQPFGQEILPIDADTYEGLWIGPGVAVAIDAINPDSGLAVIHVLSSTTGFGEDRSTMLEEYETSLMSAGDWTIANLADPEQQEGYFWLRYTIEDNVLTFWWPNVEKFAELVDEGVLPGAVETGEATVVTLGPLEPEHYERLTSGSDGVLFQWQEPVQLHRFN